MDDSELLIGKKLNEQRKAKGMTIRDLSKKSGITPSMISQVENNQVNPSINTLKLLAGALNTQLFSFFQDNQNMNECIVRSNDRTYLGKKNDDTIYELLTPDTHGDIEFMYIKLVAHSSSCDNEQSHNGEEVDYIIKGQVTVEVNGEPYILNEADSIKISRNTPHRWINDSDDMVEFISVIVKEM